MTKELYDIVAEFERCGQMHFYRGCDTDEIIRFEKDNRISFPVGYKDFLQFSDGCELFLPAGIQLYGIRQKPVIDTDDNARPSNRYIVIGVLSSGDTILINRDNEEVAIYNMADNRIESDEIYGDFILFLKDLRNILGEI